LLVRSEVARDARLWLAIAFTMLATVMIVFVGISRVAPAMRYPIRA
jgi:hypothetical protein